MECNVRLDPALGFEARKNPLVKAYKERKCIKIPRCDQKQRGLDLIQKSKISILNSLWIPHIQRTTRLNCHTGAILDR